MTPKLKTVIDAAWTNIWWGRNGSSLQVEVAIDSFTELLVAAENWHKYGAQPKKEEEAPKTGPRYRVNASGFGNCGSPCSSLESARRRAQQYISEGYNEVKITIDS